MSRNDLPRTLSRRPPVQPLVWSLTLPAWASVPRAERRGSAAPTFATALARVRPRRRNGEASPEPDGPAA